MFLQFNDSGLGGDCTKENSGNLLSHNKSPLVVHAHATFGKPFNGIPNNQTQAAKPEDHQGQVRFKGLRSQIEHPPCHIPEAAYGSCPEEACHQTVPQELPWTDTTHPDEDRKDHPEPVKKPVAEKNLKAM